MSRVVHNTSVWQCLFSFLIFACLFPAIPAQAQQANDTKQAGVAPADAGYQAGANVSRAIQGANTGQESAGPVRLAYFTYIKGDVTWRADPGAEWSDAAVNLPLREGAEIWVSEGGRAEVQFDDGSRLRLGSGALIRLDTLYSDADGEFTQIKMTGGLVTLRLLRDDSVYQVDTPLVSVKAAGPARLRLGVGDGVEIAVQEGEAAMEGAQGIADLKAGDYLDLRDDASAYNPDRLPLADSWDQWNNALDRELEAAVGAPSAGFLPPDIQIAAGDLDAYGTWRDDSQYGKVWCPHVTVPDWRPYEVGHWIWCPPFGWTWVSAEPWGWAPYHYGTWIYRPYGWAWVHGPASQCWCPAVVHFTEYHGQVAWCALAPGEVHYPAALPIHLHHGNWFAHFSIGQAGVYYPAHGNVCVAQAWNTTYVNHAHHSADLHAGHIYGMGGHMNGHGVYQANNTFVPYNAKHAAGTMVATLSAFGGPGTYRPVPRGSIEYFVQSQTIQAPPLGSIPLAGPIGVRPTPAARTPFRAAIVEVLPPQALLTRSVFRAPLPPDVQQAISSPSPAVQGVSARTGPGAPGATRTNRGMTGAANPGANPFAPGKTTGSAGPTSGRTPQTPGAGAGLSATQRAAQAQQPLGAPSSGRPTDSRSGNRTGPAASANSTPNSGSGTGAQERGGGPRPGSPASGTTSNAPPAPAVTAPAPGQITERPPTPPPAPQASPPVPRAPTPYAPPSPPQPPRPAAPPYQAPPQPPAPQRQPEPPRREPPPSSPSRSTGGGSGGSSGAGSGPRR